ncbi:hypothetical protein Tco_1020432 [Tanacetum coccineum]
MLNHQKAQIQRNQIHLAFPKAPNLSLNLQDQGNESGHLDDQPDNEAAPKHDWFQTHDKPPTPDRAWNKSKSIDSRPPQKWISTIAKARQPPRTLDELMDTPIDFSAYCYNAVNYRLDWHNPEGREYPFDLSKPFSLIEDQGRQVVPADYFINNDLEYLKGGSSCSKYVTSTTRTKAAKYDNIEGIEYMGPKRKRFYAYACHWKSPHDVYFKRRIIVVTSVKVMRWHDYGYLEEIVVRRDDNVLYKFKEGDFPRLNMCDIEDMLLLLVQKKRSNLDVDDRYDLVIRSASTAAKPCQEDSLEFYLITGNIYTDQRGTVVFPMMAATRRGRVRFIATCSYLTNIFEDFIKAQVHVSRLLLL